MNLHIAYCANRLGYTVRVLSGTQTVDEYNAGNCPWESTAVISADDKDAVPLAKLWEWAEQTAREMAAERSITTVVRNEDLLEEVSQ